MNIRLIKGGEHIDQRGRLLFSNGFDFSPVKRIFTIEHNDPSFIRGWMGHEIENRWFLAVCGAFQIKVTEVTDWQAPDISDAECEVFLLNADTLDVLHIPPGNVFCLQAIAPGSKLMVMSDYAVGVTNDEHRYPVLYGNAFQE
ncbi:WxcM-like domain-containing protein [Niabella beijingensis]|uniref:WxcM-like domain-containing protein n=1 Tax=Niabella beijingensis TaxID=2872700 RepID=UPI001CC0810A|nr:WxcM-like domain-containing protein [Niabella beijingensis]MBZ4189990.1 WxcM-like domain-containing protein [Niabella beijingensis]